MKKVIVDTETTGLQPGQICQLSYLIIDGNKILKAKNYFFEVDYVEKEALNVHGLTVDILREISRGQKFYEVAKYVYDDLNKGVIVGHNVDFDLNFLKEEFKRCGVKFNPSNTFCTMKYLTNLIKLPGKYDKYKYKYPSLRESLDYFGITDDEINTFLDAFYSLGISAHDSRYDVSAVAALVQNIQNIQNSR